MPRRVLIAAAVAGALALPLAFGGLVEALDDPETVMKPELGSDAQPEALLDWLRKLPRLPGSDRNVHANAVSMLAEGREIFRFDTFGDEAFWGDTLRLHEAIAGARFGGVGPGLSLVAALALGLKVDRDALPRTLQRDLRRGLIDLEDSATTLALLELDAVVGVTGFFDQFGNLISVGIQCALCRSAVDDSLAPGVRRRLDGWANRDLDVGAIIALAPDLGAFTSLLDVDEATVRQVLRGWGPGKFDAELLLDGKAFRPDGKPAATLLPPAFGVAGVNLHTWTGWGSVTHWNAFVANLEMGGNGTFFGSMIPNSSRSPRARALATCADCEAIPT